MADGRGADPALTVEALSKQWADAVARGDGKEAQRLNAAIAKINSDARRREAGQDRNGLTERDRALGSVRSAAQELTSQIQGDIAENDFDPDEVMPGLRLFAEQAKVPADELRQEVLKRLRESGMKRGDLKRVERALDPTAKPAQTKPAQQQAGPPAEGPGASRATTAPATARDVMPTGLRVVIGGQSYPVDSFEQASELSFKAGKEAERRAGSQQFKGKPPILDGSGRVVAHIGPGDKIIAGPARDGAPSDGEVLFDPMDAIRADIAAKNAERTIENEPTPKLSAPTPDAAAPAPQAPPQGRAPEVAAPEPIRAELQTAMEAAGWTAEVGGPGNTIWTKRQNGERYTALLLEPRGTRPLGMEVTVLTDGGVDVGIAELVVTAAAKAARDANQAIADSEAESAPPAPAPKAATLPDSTPPSAPTNPPAPPPQTRPQELIELRKRAAVLKQLLRCLL